MSLTFQIGLLLQPAPMLYHCQAVGGLLITDRFDSYTSYKTSIYNSNTGLDNLTTTNLAIIIPSELQQSTVEEIKKSSLGKQLLVDKNADISIEDKLGLTVLILAAEYRHKAVVQLLLDKKTDMTARDKNRQTALQYTIQYKYKTVVQLFKDKENKKDKEDKLAKDNKDNKNNKEDKV